MRAGAKGDRPAHDPAIRGWSAAGGHGTESIEWLSGKGIARPIGANG